MRHPLRPTAGLALVIGFTLAGCGSSDSGPPVAAVTGRGVLEGMPTELELGAEGGSLTSSDGHLTLSVAPGALAAPVRFRIQPIVSEVPGAVGLAYRLGPEGALPAPVTLRFALADERLSDDVSVATQLEDGRWRIVPARREGSMVEAEVTHFSDWALAGITTLRPSPAVLSAGLQASVELVQCPRLADGEGGTIIGVCQSTSLAGRNWAVNGIRGGNDDVGFLNSTGPAQALTYTAPSQMNWSEVVTVSAEVSTPAGSRVAMGQIQLVPDSLAYRGVVSVRRVTPDFTLSWTSQVEFDDEGNAGGQASRKLQHGECGVTDQSTGLQGSMYQLSVPNPDGTASTYYRLSLALKFGPLWTCTRSTGTTVEPTAPRADLLDFHAGCKQLVDYGGVRFARVDGDGKRLAGHEECTVGLDQQVIDWTLERVDR